ncbi:MAG: type II secretion system protein GspG [Candidatus Omnitrophica bacterium 4484_213]|nr:MAG: type II secretion system protein GspG [Candidatus Omnitrophica bacterium 4484_213]
MFHLDNQKEGFTLIELMLVVIIISILAAMVIPRLSGRSEEARQAVAKTDIEANLSLALDLYEMDNGSYPQSLDALRRRPAGADRWKGPYIKKKPVDPWGRVYIYKFPGEHNPESYDLYSLGSDGQAGTNDDVANWE